MTTTTVTYQLASTAGFKFNIVKMGFNSYDPLAYYQKENFPDVEVLRPGIPTDLQQIHTQYLMTVNGYVYLTEYIGDRLYIPNATLSMLRSRNNVIGLLDFSKFGNFTKVRITDSMVTLDNNQPAYEKVIITFPEDIVKPVLVMAGYMIFENEQYFYRISDRSFVLRLDKLNYVEKLYELDRYRDIFKELDVPVSTTNSSMVDGNLIRSETIIRKFLTLFNSFVVNLNINNLSVDKILMEKTNVPLNYRTEYNPVYPLVVGQGKLCEYFRESQVEGKYTLTTQDGYYNDYLFSHMSYRDLGVYNAHRVPGTTYKLSPAFFIKLTTNI